GWGGGLGGEGGTGAGAGGGKGGAGVGAALGVVQFGGQLRRGRRVRYWPWPRAAVRRQREERHLGHRPEGPWPGDPQRRQESWNRLGVVRLGGELERGRGLWCRCVAPGGGRRRAAAGN